MLKINLFFLIWSVLLLIFFWQKTTCVQLGKTTHLKLVSPWNTVHDWGQSVTVLNKNFILVLKKSLLSFIKLLVNVFNKYKICSKKTCFINIGYKIGFLTVQNCTRLLMPPVRIQQTNAANQYHPKNTICNNKGHLYDFLSLRLIKVWYFCQEWKQHNGTI